MLLLTLNHTKDYDSQFRIILYITLMNVFPFHKKPTVNYIHFVSIYKKIRRYFSRWVVWRFFLPFLAVTNGLMLLLLLLFYSFYLRHKTVSYIRNSKIHFKLVCDLNRCIEKLTILKLSSNALYENNAFMKSPLKCTLHI